VAASSQVIASLRNIDSSPPMDAVLALSTTAATNGPPGGGRSGGPGGNGRALPNTARQGPARAGWVALLGLTLLAVVGLNGKRKVTF